MPCGSKSRRNIKAHRSGQTKHARLTKSQKNVCDDVTLCKLLVAAVTLQVFGNNSVNCIKLKNSKAY